jgi:hypothetical protein
MHLVTFTHWGQFPSSATAIGNPRGLLKVSRTLGCVNIQSCLQWMQFQRLKTLCRDRREAGQRKKFPGRGGELSETLRCFLACGRLRDH